MDPSTRKHCLTSVFVLATVNGALHRTLSCPIHPMTLARTLPAKVMPSFTQCYSSDFSQVHAFLSHLILLAVLEHSNP